jgi:HSP20 family protein
VDDDIVSIKGEKIANIEKEGGTYLRRELKKSSFKRTFRADTNIFNLDKVSAKFLDGVLELTIPKLEPAKVTKKTVEIL